MKNSMFRVLLISMIIFFAATSALAKSASINDIKAAHIFNFARFTTWPKSMNPSEVFKICVHNKSPLLKNLQGLKGVKIKNVLIEVKEIEGINDLQECHLLVLAELKEDELNTFIKAGVEKEIMTVSDSPGYASLGVMFNLDIQGKKVVFEVNIKKLKESGLSVSSNLLKLAKTVENKGE